MNEVYDVITDLNPEQLTEVAIETYRQWLEFALGKRAIGGKTLRHPSGRYAAALSWKVTGTSSVAIIADEKAAPEAGWIESGYSGANMKEKMLAGGKMGADGFMYRDIPIRSEGLAPAFNMANLTKRGGRLPAKLGKVWAQARPAIDPESHLVRMTDRPGSSAWQIPDMPAYSPAAILSDLLRANARSFLGQ